MLADGSTINKAGTLLLAMAAHAEKVPFYVCCESFKICQQEEPPALEEMSPAELGTTQWPGVSVSNIYFDITRPTLSPAGAPNAGPQTPESGENNKKTLGSGIKSKRLGNRNRSAFGMNAGLRFFRHQFLQPIEKIHGLLGREMVWVDPVQRHFQYRWR